MICESHEAGMPNFGYTVDQALHLVWIQSRLYNNEKYLTFYFQTGHIKLSSKIDSRIICISHEAGMPNFGYTVNQAHTISSIQ